jgi:hypothetical protein
MVEVESAQAPRCWRCDAGRRAVGRRDSIVIEGTLVAPRAVPSPRRRRKSPRLLFPWPLLKAPAGRWVAAVALGFLLIGSATAFQAPITGALADLTGVASRYDGLEFQDIRTRTERTRSGRTLLVEGLVINRSPGRKAVPAIQVTLRDDGRDLFSWTIEPTADSVAGGAMIGFRSIVAPPRPGNGEVALRFVPRRDVIIGMR